jgi:hypothetical protein
MSAFSVGAACVQRVDHGASQPLTFREALEQVRHPLDGLKRDELVEVVAYLACQVVGYAHNQSADANLAMVQIEIAVRDYQKRRGHAA